MAQKRKLTVVVQLSDPADYDGGELEVWPDSTVRTAPRDRGTAVIFPSFALHRVTPVTHWHPLVADPVVARAGVPVKRVWF